MQRIIFFDIDGTLLDEQSGTVPTSAINALYKAKENNHILIINTGRPFTGVSQELRKLPFDGYICGCGTHIIYHNEDIFHITLDEKERRRIIELSYLYDIDTLLEGKYGSYFKSIIKHPIISRIVNDYQQQDLKINSYSLDVIPKFDKFTSWYTDDADINSYKEAIKDDYTIIQRDIDFVEIVPKSCSKAMGIQRLIDYLNIDINQTISIGDSTNDLSMLTYTKESVAMGNSNPVLFDQVTYITSDINEDGIYNALKHYQLFEDSYVI